MSDASTILEREINIMNFDKQYSQWFLNESVLDIPRNGLDPTVFNFPENGAPIIHPRIRAQIMDDLVEINKLVTILDYFVIGSILTVKYSSNSDIDVTLEVDEELSSGKMEDLVSVLKHIGGRLAVGTSHPINYYIVNGQYNHNKTEAVYDIANERWIKEPNEQSFNVRNYVSRLQTSFAEVDLSTAELRRDLIDFNELKKLSKEDIKGLDVEIQKKLGKIESNVEDIVSIYDNAKSLRKQAFAKVMTPQEIRKFGLKNNLPENILYKLLERYFYRDFAIRLKSLLNDGIDTKADVQRVQKTFKDFVDRVSL